MRAAAHKPCFRFSFKPSHTLNAQADDATPRAVVSQLMHDLGHTYSFSHAGAVASAVGPDLPFAPGPRADTGCPMGCASEAVGLVCPNAANAWKVRAAPHRHLVEGGLLRGANSEGGQRASGWVRNAAMAPPLPMYGFLSERCEWGVQECRLTRATMSRRACGARRWAG